MAPVCEPTWPDWINAISAAVGALVLLLGLGGAWWTIKINRKSARELRQSQVAEELIAVSLNIEDALKHIRSQMDLSVPEDEAKNKKSYLQRRYDRVVEYNHLFKSLRDAQIRVRAVIGNAEVDEAVETLFRVRSDIRLAIESLHDFADPDGATLRQSERKFVASQRRVAFGSFSDKDETGAAVVKAIKVIEGNLTPYARLTGKT